jgi:hypothetical protein
LEAVLDILMEIKIAGVVGYRDGKDSLLVFLFFSFEWLFFLPGHVA